MAHLNIPAQNRMRLIVADQDTYSVDHHTLTTTELMSFLTFVTFLSAIGCSPDAGQPDPPGPLAKHEEAQLSELCLEFLDLLSRSLTNMACRSSGMFLGATTKSRCNPVSHANQPHSFQQHLLPCTFAKVFLLRHAGLCSYSSSHLPRFVFRVLAYLIGHSLLVQLHNIIERMFGNTQKFLAQIRLCKTSSRTTHSTREALIFVQEC